MAAKIWTPARKWLGNLIPTIFWLIPVAYGVWVILTTRQFAGFGLWFILLGTVLGWIALNLFGLFDNKKMRAELARILEADSLLPSDRIFVGFTSPKYTGLLDAHEDVGFLCFYPDALRFVGERKTVEISPSEITRIQFRPNVHSIVLLGRWIGIDGKRNGIPIRMLIEPRERNTMIANVALGQRLKTKIAAWQSSAMGQAK